MASCPGNACFAVDFEVWLEPTHDLVKRMPHGGDGLPLLVHSSSFFQLAVECVVLSECLFKCLRCVSVVYQPPHDTKHTMAISCDIRATSWSKNEGWSTGADVELIFRAQRSLCRMWQKPRRDFGWQRSWHVLRPAPIAFTHDNAIQRPRYFWR